MGAEDPRDGKPDPILLSLFANRFMSVAEAMGCSLQQTSISTNIKERLDYSCAIFAPNGDLVANAPHLPVHLGSMSFAVRYQIQYLQGQIFPGDVIMANHPQAGGSHLPDITLITPVFNGETLVFFTVVHITPTLGEYYQDQCHQHRPTSSKKGRKSNHSR